MPLKKTRGFWFLYMKNFHIITIFPESFDSYLNSSILSRAKNKFLKVKFYNPRDFTSDKRRKVDTRPYGGEPGMVMQVEPIVKAADKAKRKSQNANSKIIIFSPRGKTFNQKMARNFAEKYDNFILICGRYEGIDERVMREIANEEISIGDYVLFGGEVPAMVVMESVTRLIPGAIAKQESVENESFRDVKGIGKEQLTKYIEYPHYTRPEVISVDKKKLRVPKVLLSGNHKKIDEWRNKHSK